MLREICTFVLATALAGAVIAQPVATAGSAFTYQGRLETNGVPAEGLFEFTFRLFNGATGGTELAPAFKQVLTVEDGLFSTDLDFGAGVLAGPGRYLQIEITTPGGSEVLEPRQRLAPAPASVQAGGASLFDDGSVVIKNAQSRVEEAIISTFETVELETLDTLVADPFWQSFSLPRNAVLTEIETILKLPPEPVATDWSLRRGAGPDGELVVGGSFGGASLVGEGFSSLSLLPSAEIELEAGAEYSIVIPGSNLPLALTPNVEPLAGPSVAGPNFALVFELTVLGEPVAATQFDTFGNLRIESLVPQVRLVSELGGLAARFVSEVSGGAARWAMASTESRKSFEYAAGSGAFTPIMSIDGPDRRVGIGDTPPLATLHIEQAGLGLAEASLWNEDLVVEDSDAVIGLYSSQGGGFGSTISLGEVELGGALANKWSIVKRVGDTGELQFTQGTNGDYSLNAINLALRTDGSAWLRGALQQNSTAEEKHDIETLTEALDTLLAIRGVSYAWNATEKKDIGFIAEEMAGVLPEVVGFDSDGNATGIDYGRLTALIIEAVKEQQREIESMSERLERVERLLAE